MASITASPLTNGKVAIGSTITVNVDWGFTPLYYDTMGYVSEVLVYIKVLLYGTPQELWMKTYEERNQNSFSTFTFFVDPNATYGSGNYKLSDSIDNKLYIRYYGYSYVNGYATLHEFGPVSYDMVKIPEIVWPNPNVKVTQSGYQAKVSWNSASVANGTGSETITYQLFSGSDSLGTLWTGTGTSVTVTPRSYNTNLSYYLYAYSSGVSGGKWSNTVYATISRPEITAHPTISSINPSSGASTTITWRAATVSNQGNSTIYYQYFVGPNSTYSDSYHIGTTTGTSATISEAQIISKCGNGFGASSSGSTCYLFVRAYWQDSSGTTGGWIAPTGKAFIYYPTVNAPTNFSITPTTGQSTVLKWNNIKAGNNSNCQIILYIDNNQVASGIQGSNGGYTIGENVWKTLGEGNHAIKIAHEYYGRYAYTSSLTFTYKKPYQTISYYTNGNFVPCKVFYYTNNEWKLCNINYYTNGSWRPCSTT